MARSFDIVVIGGGVIGCAIARELSGVCNKSIALIEKEFTLAFHTSSRNSGVLHSGFNQRPGTLKANFCVRGNRLIRDYCRDRRIALIECGTLVIAKNEHEKRVLRELELRGKRNNVPGIRIIDKAELKKLEPNVLAEEALFSPTGCVIDSRAFTYSLASDAIKNGTVLLTNERVISCEENGENIEITTNRGRILCKLLINCAGLYADEIARMFGVANEYMIIPFKGKYFRLREDRRGLVNSMVYRAPNLSFPFLGIHFTRRVNGDVIVGPDASLAIGREQYSIADVNIVEFLKVLTFLGTLRAIRRRDYISMLIKGLYTSLKGRRVFAESAKEIIPLISEDDLIPDISGIRAQLISIEGKLVEDFLIEWAENSIHILNSVSPGLTCSLPFAEFVANEAESRGYI